jgi:hypothetical protein
MYFITLHYKVLFMEKQSEHLETLSEIRSMMERSTKFISLNGLSGIFAGVFALIGAFAAYLFLKEHSAGLGRYEEHLSSSQEVLSFFLFFFVDAILVLFASLTVAISLSIRKARKKGLKVWDNTTKRVLFNMMVPLAAGGFFCLILIYHGYIGLVAPAMLIFYGLSLVNTSKYTFDDIRYLGLFEIFFGLLAAVWIGYGLFFWAIGFGLLHIIYGIIMYYKYEK